MMRGVSVGSVTSPSQFKCGISGTPSAIAALNWREGLCFTGNTCFTLRLLGAGSSTACFTALRSSLAEITGNRRINEQETAHRKDANFRSERRRNQRHKEGANNNNQNMSRNLSKTDPSG
jgi:hypothetical protein